MFDQDGGESGVVSFSTLESCRPTLPRDISVLKCTVETADNFIRPCFRSTSFADANEFD